MDTVQYQWDLRANLQGRCAAAAMLLFDVLITAEDEFELVWKGKWSMPKSLYLFTRYHGLATAILLAVVSNTDHSNSFCRVFNEVEYLLLYTVTASTDCLLLMRVCALYGRRTKSEKATRLILKIIYGAVVAIYLISIVLISADKFVLGADALDDSNFGCMSVTTQDTQAQYSLIMTTSAAVVLNVILFTMTMIKVIPGWITTLRARSRLEAQLLRDGAIYFALVLASILVVGILAGALIDRPGIQMAGLPWSVTVMSIAGYRMFLSLKGSTRETSYGDGNETTVDGDHSQDPGRPEAIRIISIS